MRNQASGDLDFVVQDERGKPVKPHSLSMYWHRRTKKIKGIAEPRPVFHDLRHGCAHRLVASGISMPVLQKFMGHEKLETTRIYMPDVTFDQLADALAAVPVPTCAPVVPIAGA